MNQDIVQIQFFAYIILALSICPVIIDIIKSKRIVFDNPLYIPFALLALFMGFRLLFLSDHESWGLFQNLTGIVNPVPYLEKIGLYVAASMIAMMLGYYFFSHPLLQSPGISLQWSKAHGEGLARIQLPGLLIVSIIFLLIGYWSTARVAAGGFADTSGYIYMLSLTKTGLLTLITVYLLGRLPYKLRSSIFNPTYLILLVAFIIYIKTSFSTQGRFQLVAPLVAFGILILRFNPSSKKLQSLMILSFVLGLFFFNLAGAMRIANDEVNRGREFNFQNIYRWYTERLSTAEDFNGVEGMAFNMVYFNDQEGYLWGKSYAAVLWHWWPRGFVEKYLGIKKPMTMGTHLKGIFLADSNRLETELDRSSTLGFSATFLGQNYENFGFIGGVILAFFQGVGLALLFNWVTRRYYSINVQAFYACFLAAMPGLARGGAIAIDGANAFMGYLPVIVVFLLFKGSRSNWLPTARQMSEIPADDPMNSFPPGPGDAHAAPMPPPMPVSRVRMIQYPKKTLPPPEPNK